MRLRRNAHLGAISPGGASGAVPPCGKRPQKGDGSAPSFVGDLGPAERLNVGLDVRKDTEDATRQAPHAGDLRFTRPSLRHGPAIARYHSAIQGHELAPPVDFVRFP